jgi:toxin CcdB
VAQFRVYRNPSPDTKSRFPLLLDVQSDLIGQLETRVVVPLSPAAAMASRQMTILMPTFVIDDRKFAMRTPQLAGIPASGIGAEVADLASHREQIIAALDLLVTGF